MRKQGIERNAIQNTHDWKKKHPSNYITAENREPNLQIR